MSEYEAEVYEKFSSRVQRQIQSLRVLLESFQAKGKERHWVRHQTSGDLDDAKLIEGLTGEKTIYKKRADQEPDVSSFNVVNSPLKSNTRQSLLRKQICTAVPNNFSQCAEYSTMMDDKC